MALADALAKNVTRYEYLATIDALESHLMNTPIGENISITLSGFMIGDMVVDSYEGYIVARYVVNGDTYLVAADGLSINFTKIVADARIAAADLPFVEEN